MYRVLSLSNRLRADGIECIIDQYEMSPPEGWPRWTDHQIEQAKYVLVVCTEVYKLRFRGQTELGKGLGVKWEGAVITQNLYDAEAKNDKFIPVLLDPGDAVHIPTVLRGATRYDLTTDTGYEGLYRRITNQPEVQMPPIGTLRPLPRLDQKQEFTPLQPSNVIKEASVSGNVLQKNPGPKGVSSRRASRLNLLLLVLPTVMAISILLILFNWRLPTHLKLNLTVNRLVFSLGGGEKRDIVNSLSLAGVVIERFNTIELQTENSRTINIKSKGERFQSTVSLTGTGSEQSSSLAMESFRADPGSEITLEALDDANELTVRIDGEHSSGNITAAGLIHVQIDQCDVTGTDNLPPNAQSTSLLTKLQTDSSISFEGRFDSILLTLTVPPTSVANLFPKVNIPITSIRFERQTDQSGEIVSSLVTDGELSYPEYEAIARRKIASTEFISLDDLSRFSIEQIKYDPGAKGFTLSLQGIANKIKTETSDFGVDHRLTAYQAVSSNHRFILIAGLICWVLGTVAGARKHLVERVKPLA